MKVKIVIALIGFLIITGNLSAQTADRPENDKYRPQFHFTPKKAWMNDPNGMVYLNGKYHLFFQHNPDSTVWGPMHWGHAISTDLMHWEEQPIALYPDSLGTIFSGSAVVDINNTSGFGTEGRVPLVAIFTHHNHDLEKKGSGVYQYQSLAYSLDEGKTWTKYKGNPVLPNPGIKDFRDPKVMWHEAGKKWVMTLATMDRITFYSSPDLKTWSKESEFGKDQGGHGGVWECPDLFSLKLNGRTHWVLLVSINPGGPNGGSATQYFIGQFDGKNFKPDHQDTRWIDYGTDNYAGITWSNTGNRKIFIGWMNNWQYANLVPTDSWRSAMTIPRELKLKQVDNEIFVSSEPVKELEKITLKPVSLTNIKVRGSEDLSSRFNTNGVFKLRLNSDNLQSFAIVLANDLGEKVRIGYDESSNRYYIDRTKAGKNSFEKGFAKVHYAPRIGKSRSTNITLLVDAASVELFADNGLTVMTDIFFPNKTMNKVRLDADASFYIKSLTYVPIDSIWN